MKRGVKWAAAAVGTVVAAACAVVWWIGVEHDRMQRAEARRGWSE